MWKLYKITADRFMAAVTTDPADKFAKTFIAKANMQKMWDSCVGLVDTDTKKLLGAIIVTVSKNKPHCANLQLLHTFAEHRRMGVGSQLVTYAMEFALAQDSTYFRVSSEPDAVIFYESLGFKFYGKQKSGTSLSICLLQGDSFHECVYDATDPYIKSKLFTKAKGGLVHVY